MVHFPSTLRIVENAGSVSLEDIVNIDGACDHVFADGSLVLAHSIVKLGPTGDFNLALGFLLFATLAGPSGSARDVTIVLCGGQSLVLHVFESSYGPSTVASVLWWTVT